MKRFRGDFGVLDCLDVTLLVLRNSTFWLFIVKFDRSVVLFMSDRVSDIDFVTFLANNL